MLVAGELLEWHRLLIFTDFNHVCLHQIVCVCLSYLVVELCSSL